jgi:ABC-2 type transport system ATP-binding protein
LLQGTDDTLFPLQEAIDSYRILRRNDVPVAMRWFCGGHGLCPLGTADPRPVERAVLAWFRAYLQREGAPRTGRRFIWTMDDGTRRSAADYPLPRIGSLRGRGSGRVVLSPAHTAPGLFLTAARAPRALNVAIRAPRRGRDVVGAPKVRLTYRATARGGARTWLYAQVVEREQDRVLGNQVTPVPILLDGRRHALTRRLEVVATRAARGSRYVLQLTDATSIYARQRVRGTVRVARVDVALPVVR